MCAALRRDCARARARSKGANFGGEWPSTPPVGRRLAAMSLSGGGVGERERTSSPSSSSQSSSSSLSTATRTHLCSQRPNFERQPSPLSHLPPHSTRQRNGDDNGGNDDSDRDDNDNDGGVSGACSAERQHRVTLAKRQFNRTSTNRRQVAKCFYARLVDASLA